MERLNPLSFAKVLLTFGEEGTGPGFFTDARHIAALPEGDRGALLDFGIEFAVRQCAQLLKAGVPGLHIYTMDRSKSTAGIVNRLRGDGLL